MTKGTVYIQHPDNQTDLDYPAALIESGVNSVKFEGRFNFKEIHALDKSVRIVARHIAVLEGDDESGFKQDYKYGEGDPKVAAVAHFALLKANATPSEYVWWCSPYNEVGQLENPDKRRWYNDFELERQRLYASNPAGRYRAALFGFGVKANLHDKIEEFLPAIRLAVVLGNLLDVHCYSSPTLMDYPEYLFAYRLIYEELKRRGEPCPAFFLGEFGYDRLPDIGGEDGFRPGGLSNEEYARQLEWAFDQFGNHPADALLVGAAVFIFSDEPEYQPDYNIKWARQTKKGEDEDPGVAYRLLDYFAAHKGDPIVIPSGSPAPVPTPTPTPAPDPSTDYQAKFNGLLADLDSLVKKYRV